MKNFRFLILPMIFLSLTQIFLAQEKGNLKGIVKDAQSGEALVGANIYLKGTSIGSATDIKGKYIIRGIPAGKYKLKASFLGYQPQEVTITIRKNKTLIQNFNLNFSVVKENEVVVTAQAEGQMNAINRQLSSETIQNVVSAKQIQEIPDANAAESIGRLPGVSLIRSGGEGSKVVIRGLSPQFSKIQIEGVSMASTGEGQNGGERSTDLSMISPYMLQGIEVTKAATPDNEADVIGGNVNFLLKEAPDKFTVDALAQSSYNNLKSTYGDYKFVLSGSNRLFDKKLGIFAQVDVEKRNRGSYELNTDFINEQHPSDPAEVDVTLNNLSLKDVTRTIHRYGVSLVTDYKLPKGVIKFNNFSSAIKKRNINRVETHQPIQRTHLYGLEDLESELAVMTNALTLDYDIWNVDIHSGISYAFSEKNAPQQIKFNGYESAAYDNSVDLQGNPRDIPKHAYNNLKETLLNNLDVLDIYSKETALSAFADLKYQIKLWSFGNLKLKIGYKYRHQNKFFNKNVARVPFSWDHLANNSILEAYPWMQKYAPLGSLRLPYFLFIDKDYKPNNFLEGQYIIQNVPRLDLVDGITDVLKTKNKEIYRTHFPQSIKNDYNGYENYNAVYIMPTFEFGQSVTFMPGLRYEKNVTTYTGVRGNEGTRMWWEGYPYKTLTTTRKNEFFLPMIHLKIKPLNWFDLRLAYTETLSRPNYNSIIPAWNINSTYVLWKNPNLKPAHSKNYDIYTSFYTNALGLFTFGVFKKEIVNMLFWGGNSVILDASKFGLPELENGKIIGRMVNNKYPVNLYGYEIEWQTHFWYLPSVLKGLVFKINYTFTHSEAKYPKVEVKTKYLNKPPWVIQTNLDTFYTDRLINQPNNIINMTLGYDYKGFSARVSFLFQDNIFKRTNFYERLRGKSAEGTKWDISVRQKLPVNGLEIIGNFANITSAIEKDINMGTNYPLREQHYGMTIDLGLRYRLN